MCPRGRYGVDAIRGERIGRATQVMTTVLKHDTELFKQFMDNESFRRWLTETVFGLPYDRPGEAGQAG